MLLLGALFALFGAGFWLYCLTDVALTPGRECRALPKTAWIVLSRPRSSPGLWSGSLSAAGAAHRFARAVGPRHG